MVLRRLLGIIFYNVWYYQHCVFSIHWDIIIEKNFLAIYLIITVWLFSVIWSAPSLTCWNWDMRINLLGWEEGFKTYDLYETNKLLWFIGEEKKKRWENVPRKLLPNGNRGIYEEKKERIELEQGQKRSRIDRFHDKNDYPWTSRQMLFDKNPIQSHWIPQAYILWKLL